MHLEPVFTTVAVVFEVIGAFAMCVGFVVAVVLGVRSLRRGDGGQAAFQTLRTTLGAAILLLGGKRTNKFGPALATGLSWASFAVGAVIFVTMLGLGAEERAAHAELWNWIPAGQFQLNLSGSASQMVRVSLSADIPAIPEVSANKYFLNIRFTKPPAGEIKARCCDFDVAFDLTFCNL